MERDQESNELIELGTASTDTLGTQIVAAPEDHGFYPLGLSDE
jgi:hypothetical protein